MPTSPPPCASLNFTLPGLSLTYFLARRATSGAEPVAPLIVMVLAAEAAAGAATERTPTAAAAAARRRVRVIASGTPISQFARSEGEQYPNRTILIGFTHFGVGA